jgi:hypothetical protein
MDRWEKRYVANRVRADQYVEAVAWSKEPAVRNAVKSVFKRATDTGIMLAALPAMDISDWGFVSDKFAAILRQQPVSESGWYGTAYRVLKASRDFGGAKAKPLFRQYLEKRSAYRCFSVCAALTDGDATWDAEFLYPLLNDKRKSNVYAFPKTRTSSPNENLIRVCDAAAGTIALHHPELKFELVGAYEEVDRKIAEMKRTLQIRRKSKSN